MSQLKVLSSTTQHGMPGLRRPPAMTRDRLIRLATAAVPILTRAGAVHTAAVCDAYLVEVAKNDLLRRQINELNEWKDEPTRRASFPLVEKTTETVDVPEDTLTMLKAVNISDDEVRRLGRSR